MSPKTGIQIGYKVGYKEGWLTARLTAFHGLLRQDEMGEPGAHGRNPSQVSHHPCYALQNGVEGNLVAIVKRPRCGIG